MAEILDKAVKKRELPEDWKIRLEIMKCSIEPDCWNSFKKITERILNN